MLPTSESAPPSPRSRPRRRRSTWSLRLTPGGLLILLLLNLLTIALIAYFLFQVQVSGVVQSWLASRVTELSTETLAPSATVELSPTATTAPPTQTLTPTVAQATPTAVAPLQKGLIVLSLTEGIHSHIFAYQPQLSSESGTLPLTRLMNGPWDDLHPAISPDGKKLAFMSNRNGYWDLYVLELPTGLVQRLTDSLAYDGSPAWSPDGVWIVYESYVDDNLEIFILNVQSPQEPIRLTNHPAADHSPAWSPQGRQIAFVSNRAGGDDIWLADLDQADENLFVNLTSTVHAQEAYPSWSGDGSRLAWASVHEGFHELMFKDMAQLDLPPVRQGSGDVPVWEPDGDLLLAGLFAPYTHYLTAYSTRQPGLVLPMLALPGFLSGLDWRDAAISIPLNEIYRQAAVATPTPLWIPIETPLPNVPQGRSQVVRLENVQAPSPYLHDKVDESFQALRAVVAEQAGWDVLSSLENAFVPLTTSLGPGMGQDWLYTGRAFALNTAPLNAGWLAVVREDFGVQTFWRVYVRARYQDGSTGMPMRALPWNFSARFGSNTSSYELGGAPETSVPPGYWLDFTRLASAYGWQRLPALPFWRASYPAALFNEFAFTAGLDWQQAIVELYPPEALVTPSPIVPATRTPSPTPRWYQSPTPTLTQTPRPTLTPLPPTVTPSPTQSPVAARTLSPTPAPTRSATPALPSPTMIVPTATPTP